MNKENKTKWNSFSGSFTIKINIGHVACSSQSQFQVVRIAKTRPACSKLVCQKGFVNTYNYKRWKLNCIDIQLHHKRVFSRNYLNEIGRNTFPNGLHDNGTMRSLRSDQRHHKLECGCFFCFSIFPDLCWMSLVSVRQLTDGIRDGRSVSIRR